MAVVRVRLWAGTPKSSPRRDGADDLGGEGGALGHRLGAGAPGHVEHDPARVVLALLALVADGALVHGLHVLLGDADPALDPELEHLAFEELAAELVPVVLLGEPGALGVAHQVGHGEALGGGDVLEGGVDLVGGDGDLGLVGGLPLQLVVDHLLEQLLEDLRLGRCLLRAGGHLLGDLDEEGLGAVAELREEDGPVADDLTTTPLDHDGARGALPPPATPRRRRRRQKVTLDRARREARSMAHGF